MLDMSAMICFIGKYNCILLSFVFCTLLSSFSDEVGTPRPIRLWWCVGLGMYYIGTNDTRSNTAPDSNGSCQPAVALNTITNKCHC